ncbi:(4Fe-4S)-binding protein [Mangrovimonas xylaniphaga]|uniref:(4Fe-4S)-binding protein n=1 Tax=Mangrovimonas xylaniphaga TaxID=1645915 RepID=UPI0006B5B60B|nr:(4Fe-4S)-binding protein [Mangrovimonas xylaniphaga]
MDVTKEYSNGEVTIVWEPRKCIHSGICVKGLPDVFQPQDKPWIKIQAASTSALVNQVKQCPSGALSFYMNGAKQDNTKAMETKVEIMENGPLLVHGTLSVNHTDGRTETKDKTTAFCRCGGSANKPYCDGTHRKIDFGG